MNKEFDRILIWILQNSENLKGKLNPSVIAYELNISLKEVIQSLHQMQKKGFIKFECPYCKENRDHAEQSYMDSQIQYR